VHVDFLDLAEKERDAAIAAVKALTERFRVRGARLIFQALARGEALAGLKSLPGLDPADAQLALNLRSSSLLRTERAAAVGAALAIRLDLDDEAAAERVIRYLAQTTAVMETLIYAGIEDERRDARPPRALAVEEGRHLVN
jgi:hypothetical protein